jgi:hypothetical protein
MSARAVAASAAAAVAAAVSVATDSTGILMVATVAITPGSIAIEIEPSASLTLTYRTARAAFDKRRQVNVAHEVGKFFTDTRCKVAGPQVDLNAVKPVLDWRTFSPVLVPTPPKHVFDRGFVGADVQGLRYVLLTHPAQTHFTKTPPAGHFCIEVSFVSRRVRPIFERAAVIPVELGKAIVLQGNVIDVAQRGACLSNVDFGVTLFAARKISRWFAG